MKTIFSAIALLALIQGASAEAEVPLPNMVEVQRQIAKSKPADLSRVSVDFESAMKQADLSPSPNIRAETKAVQDASMKLLVGLGEGKFTKDAGETKAVSAAIRTTLNKLDSLIEENYQEQLGVANVSPPPGTPNAAAGMHPHAISDPKLRQQYLDAIENEKAKQEKNAQQREMKTARKLILMQIAALDPWRSTAGLSKDDLIGQFTGDGKSRELLRKLVIPEVKPCFKNGPK